MTLRPSVIDRGDAGCTRERWDQRTMVRCNLGGARWFRTQVCSFRAQLHPPLRLIFTKAVAAIHDLDEPVGMKRTSEDQATSADPRSELLGECRKKILSKGGAFAGTVDVYKHFDLLQKNISKRSKSKVVTLDELEAELEAEAASGLSLNGTAIFAGLYKGGSILATDRRSFINGEYQDKRLGKLYRVNDKVIFAVGGEADIAIFLLKEGAEAGINESNDALLVAEFYAERCKAYRHPTTNRPARSALIVASAIAPVEMSERSDWTILSVPLVWEERCWMQLSELNMRVVEKPYVKYERFALVGLHSLLRTRRHVRQQGLAWHRSFTRRHWAKTPNWNRRHLVSWPEPPKVKLHSDWKPVKTSVHITSNAAKKILEDLKAEKKRYVRLHAEVETIKEPIKTFKINCSMSYTDEMEKYDQVMEDEGVTMVVGHPEIDGLMGHRIDYCEDKSEFVFIKERVWYN